MWFEINFQHYTVDGGFHILLYYSAVFFLFLRSLSGAFKTFGRIMLRKVLDFSIYLRIFVLSCIFVTFVPFSVYSCYNLYIIYKRECNDSKNDRQHTHLFVGLVFFSSEKIFSPFAQSLPKSENLYKKIRKMRSKPASSSKDGGRTMLQFPFFQSTIRAVNLSTHAYSK